jgi:hypothetical protein
MKLQTDRHNFPIVHSPAEITQAISEGHPNVKATCPICGVEKLVATPRALDKLSNGCTACQNQSLNPIL